MRRLSGSLTPVMVASLSLALAFVWMLLAVQIRYQGDWTGLFHIGGGIAPPAEAGGTPSTLRGDDGYDGQFYRLVARDPFLTRGYARYVDSPEMRWQRILVPALAWELALGRSGWVDGAYIAVILGWVFAGSFWGATLARGMGYPAWMGGGFLLLPATLAALDRMTVDVALAALLLGALCVGEDGSEKRLWLLAAGAALCRETGTLLAVALVARALMRRRFALAARLASSLAPAAAWFWYVRLNTPRTQENYLSWIPLEGLLRRFLHESHVAPDMPLRELHVLLEYLALSGALLAVLLIIQYRPGLNSLQGTAAWCFLLPVLFVNHAGVWSEPFAYGRTLTPFWLLIALESARLRRWTGLLPVALIDLPLMAQFVYYVAALLKPA
ncbi:MAG: hypothetical protein ABFD86_10795 [Bryobacteraceae bacterium]